MSTELGEADGRPAELSGRVVCSTARRSRSALTDAGPMRSTTEDRGDMDDDIAGTLYPGDLLAGVLRVPVEWFAAHPAAASALDGVVASVDVTATDDLGLPLLDETEVPTLLEAWHAHRPT